MRIAVGISGGVDSAVTALLLKERGDDVVGVTMTLGRTDENRSLAEARAVAKRLDLPFEVCDFSKLWHEVVIGYIRETYLAGRTPNPCVRCNERIKFSALPRWAFETLGCDRFATGHYARTQGGRLFRGVDHAKDQSYFLYRVEKEILARTEFPLGGMTKEQVREVWMDEVEKRGGGGQRTDKHSTVHLFSPPPPIKLTANEPDKVLAFVRGNLLFVFNFNPTRSFEDYGILVPPASDWKHLFDSDEPRFSGQGRIAPGMTYAPSLVLYNGELVQQIKLYLPARTATVLKRV